jgi:hypothetical protein
VAEQVVSDGLGAIVAMMLLSCTRMMLNEPAEQQQNTGKMSGSKEEKKNHNFPSQKGNYQCH